MSLRWKSLWLSATRIKAMLQFPLNISTAGLFGLLLKHFKRESRMWWKERLMIEESWYKNELCGRKYACIGGLPLLAPTVSVSAGDAKWLQVVPRERWIKATGRAVVFPCLWSQKVDSTGKPGKIWRWEKVLICSDSPVLQTSVVSFHLDQRAQPHFQACKQRETSAAESMIFPVRVFREGLLKQTPPCCWPHPWPLELWPLHVYICAGMKGKWPRMVLLIVRKLIQYSVVCLFVCWFNSNLKCSLLYIYWNGMMRKAISSIEL